MPADVSERLDKMDESIASILSRLPASDTSDEPDSEPDDEPEATPEAEPDKKDDKPDTESEPDKEDDKPDDKPDETPEIPGVPDPDKPYADRPEIEGKPYDKNADKTTDKVEDVAEKPTAHAPRVRVEAPPSRKRTLRSVLLGGSGGPVATGKRRK